MKEAILILFAVLTLASAGVVLFSRKLIYSAFALLLTLGGVAAFYAAMGADFLAAIQLIVYVGGVLVLVIFAVMLTGKASDSEESNPSRYSWLSPVLVTVFLGGILGAVWTVPFAEGELMLRPTTATLGNLLLTDYLLPFEVISLLLLTGLVGAVAIVRITVKGEKQ